MSILEKIRYLAISMRPRQWVKNGFVFAGLIFSKSFLKVGPVLETIYCFILFSMVSGAVYILNDIFDKERDALHPVKRHRPIASGNLDFLTSLVFSLLVLAISLTISACMSIKLFLVLFTYFLLVISYSLALKNILIIDVLALSAGFVLRTVGGAVAIAVRISPWLLLCTTLLALFLALHKRRNELMVMSDKAGEHKKILEQYTPELINSMLSVITPATVMSYSLYTFSAGRSSYMMLTIPFVLYGVFRYQYLVITKELGGSPETALFTDKPLLINVALWIIASALIVTFL